MCLRGGGWNGSLIRGVLLGNCPVPHLYLNSGVCTIYTYLLGGLGMFSWVLRSHMYSLEPFELNLLEVFILGKSKSMYDMDGCSIRCAGIINGG